MDPFKVDPDPFKVTSDVFLLTQNVWNIFKDKGGSLGSVYLRDVPVLMLLLSEINDSLEKQPSAPSETVTQALEVCKYNFKDMCECLKRHRWSSSSGLMAIFKTPSKEVKNKVSSFRESVRMLREISMNSRTQNQLDQLIRLILDAQTRPHPASIAGEMSRVWPSDLLQRANEDSEDQLVARPHLSPSAMDSTSRADLVVDDAQTQAIHRSGFALKVHLVVDNGSSDVSEHRTARLLLDSGADENVVSTGLLLKYDLQHLQEKTPPLTFKGYNGDEYTTDQIISLTWFDQRAPAVRHKAFFRVLPSSPYDLVLGHVWIQRNYDLVPKFAFQLTLFTKKRDEKTRKREKHEKLEADRKARELIEMQDNEPWRGRALEASSSGVIPRSEQTGAVALPRALTIARASHTPQLGPQSGPSSQAASLSRFTEALSSRMRTSSPRSIWTLRRRVASPAPASTNPSNSQASVGHSAPEPSTTLDRHQDDILVPQELRTTSNTYQAQISHPGELSPSQWADSVATQEDDNAKAPLPTHNGTLTPTSTHSTGTIIGNSVSVAATNGNGVGGSTVPDSTSGHHDDSSSLHHSGSSSPIAIHNSHFANAPISSPEADHDSQPADTSPPANKVVSNLRNPPHSSTL